MEKIIQDISGLVGLTPMIKLEKFCRDNGCRANIYAKLEFYNPAGSIKDRIALSMILDAEEKGLLTEGSVIVEPTSGNTGIGLAAIGASRGYKVILTMPETMSVERRKLLKAFGAQLILTEGSLGMKGAIQKAKEIVSETKDAFMPSQFDNEANPRTHYENTGPQIWEDMDGNVDIFVAGIGTGGTISGAGKYLKEKDPDIQVIGVEPEDSPILSCGEYGPHKIQGIGAGFIPATLDTEIYDEVLTVSNEDAFSMGAAFPLSEGILIGISSGAALKAAMVLAERPENKDKNIVVIFPDGGDRYLSTPMYDN